MAIPWGDQVPTDDRWPFTPETLKLAIRRNFGVWFGPRRTEIAKRGDAERKKPRRGKWRRDRNPPPLDIRKEKVPTRFSFRRTMGSHDAVNDGVVFGRDTSIPIPRCGHRRTPPRPERVRRRNIAGNIHSVGMVGYQGGVGIV